MPEQDLVRSLAERLGSSASVKAVYGEPISAEGRTIVPVARIAYGFGGGSGKGQKGDQAEHEGWGEGSGGGGGVMAKPVGVVEITRDGTRFIRYGETSRLAGAALLGLAVGFLAARRRR
jgi:uncharacterized spore protein YtfJ